MNLTTAPTSVHKRRRLWRPNLIVFTSNFCIMVLELVAGRIIAPYVGVSLYTWTSVIGIVLAGISLGNYLGGRLADRRASLRLLGLIFLSGGLAALIILGVDRWNTLLPPSLPITVRIILLTLLLFFLPSTILGMTSPVVAKLAVNDLGKTGSIVGNIYAAGTVGSIAGTFATGFYLISTFGTHTIVWGVALIIISMGLIFLLDGRVAALAVILLIGGVTPLATSAGWLRSICMVETNYFCIRIASDERDGEPVRKLILDRLVHSFNSLDNPLKLTYDYEQIYAELTAYQQVLHPQPAALFIGGGGYTFPRYMEQLYPGSHLEVIEIDPGVTRVAYEFMGLSADSDIISHNRDARQFLVAAPKRQFDIIFGDAFNDFSVPYHLTTREFNELIVDWLSPDGIYVVNLIDGGHANFLRAYVSTLRQSFDHVYLAPTLELWRQSPRSTFVVVASNTPLELQRFRQIETPAATGEFLQRVMSPARLNRLLNESPAPLLTDRFAPVEQLLAPAFRDETLP